MLDIYAKCNSLRLSILLLLLPLDSYQDNRLFLSCSSRPDEDAAIRVPIASIYGNAPDTGKGAAVWNEQVNKNFCTHGYTRRAKLPATVIIPCQNCTSCPSLSHMLHHHPTTAFIMFSTDIQHFWFDYITKMTFLRMSDEVPDLRPDANCTIAEDETTPRSSLVGNKALIGFVIILTLSLLCLICTVLFCLRTHQKLTGAPIEDIMSSTDSA